MRGLDPEDIFAGARFASPEDEPDPPACADCGDEARSFTDGVWVCDSCDDARWDRRSGA